MNDLPERFTDRIEAKNEQDRLKKIGYLETIAEHRCPFLSTSQIAQVRGVSNGTAREHLRELRDSKAVSSREIPGGGAPTEVWWLNYEESDWPIPDDLERLPGDKKSDSPTDISVADLVMLRKPRKVIHLAAFVIGYGILLVALGWAIIPIAPQNISSAMIGFATLLLVFGLLFAVGSGIKLISNRTIDSVS